jgi:hypothetical protein
MRRNDLGISLAHVRPALERAEKVGAAQELAHKRCKPPSCMGLKQSPTTVAASSCKAVIDSLPLYGVAMGQEAAFLSPAHGSATNGPMKLAVLSGWGSPIVERRVELGT